MVNSKIWLCELDNAMLVDFQSLMNRILLCFFDVFMVAYLDDLLIFREDDEPKLENDIKVCLVS